MTAPLAFGKISRKKKVFSKEHLKYIFNIPGTMYKVKKNVKTKISPTEVLSYSAR
jgi:hypothetical protein